jgi:calcium homeostasis ER protein
MPTFEMPYHKLPAGLMVEFIKTEDYDYEPLDPTLFKLPQLEMPSEKLIKAVEDFYNLNNPNKPRNP